MNKELLNSLTGEEERIENQPIWDVRCWLEGLNQGEYLKVIKDGQVYTNADELFNEIVSYGEYERNIEDGNVLTVVYKNGDVIKLQGIKNVSKKDIILSILEGLNTNSKLLEASELGISDKLWSEIIQIIDNSRMMFGISIQPYGNKDLVMISGRDKAKITINGIEYLEHNKK